MSKKHTIKPIAAAVGTAFAVTLAASPIASADTNPFGMSDLSSGYRRVVEIGNANANTEWAISGLPST